jgi:hypothetical protein
MTLDEEKAPLSERKVLKPPPMVLDGDDVNGFRKTEAGRKLAAKEEKRGRRARILHGVDERPTANTFPVCFALGKTGQTQAPRLAV